jgi:hypothetical protein
MSKIRLIARKLKKIDVVWRYASNFSPTLKFVRRVNTLSENEHTLLDELNRSGVVVTSIEKLIDDGQEFCDLDSAASELIKSKKDELAVLRARADDKSAIGNKTFNLEMLGGELKFNLEDIFGRFALNEALLRIADAYFGLCVNLRYYNVWQTFASKGSSRESQLWHFDREDNYILKVFLYLDDVEEGAGPFTYAPGTHKKGKYRKIKPEYFVEGGVSRSTDDQMKAVYPEDKWVRATGKKGTIVFADTRGYHKGGEARTKDRLMFTCMFTSPASESRQLISISDDLDLSLLTERQRQAIQF